MRNRRPIVNRKALINALDDDSVRALVLALAFDVPDGAAISVLRKLLAGHPGATTRRMMSLLDEETVGRVLNCVGFERPISSRAAEPSSLKTVRSKQVARESRFVAIDFETADHEPDSACAVALVRVHGSSMVDRAYRLIRPPRRNILFSWVHGLTWNDLKEEPTFDKVWPELSPMLDDVDFLVAHNAPFDRNVLRACCQRAGLPMPALEFKCTVKWSRRTFDLPRANLPTVCAHLGIELDHHHALSDAEACARIMMAVQQRWLMR
jgi:DNA polymerase-3 subunit epsilon